MGKVDILIVGAGAAGAAVAWQLSRDTNLHVLCLEQGEFMKRESFPSTQLNWEEQKFNSFSANPNIRKLEADYPINDTESPISIANFNAVGGSMILYSGHFPRFHPSDFRVKSLDGVAEDWPLSYEELEPYYQLNDKMMGVSGLSGDPAYPPIDGLMPPVPVGKMGCKLAIGFNALGWHWWPSYSAINTGGISGRPKCLNLGACNLGCASGAKSSVDVTYWPIAQKNGVELRVRCRVKEILVAPGPRVTGVRYFDEIGCERFQEASVVVLACNGIGTPRLMLNSKSHFFPDGLANSSGMVGRNLMLHPTGFVEGVFEENLDSNRGPQGSCILSQEFYESDPSRGFVRGYTMQVLRAPGPLETALSGVARKEIAWGKAFHSEFLKRFGRTANLAIIVEDLPEMENRVCLDHRLCDSNGIPAPKIIYRLSDNSKRMLAHGLGKGRTLMMKSGATKTAAYGPVRQTGWHLMGTTKMGVDRRSSVVNRWGQTHDVPNLLVADSSVFVTSSGANPASTLQAVALRIADNLKRNISDILAFSRA